jgi:type II secretory pathway component GspD/PulD (secretin)
MKKVLWHALTLSLLGLVSCGEFAQLSSPAFAGPGGFATPVSGSRVVSVNRNAMPVGGVVIPKTARNTRRTTRYHRSKWSYRRPSYVSTRKRSVAPKAIESTNRIIGVAVIPDESTVRLVIEGSETFIPEIASTTINGTPTILVRVPGTLSDVSGTGSVAVHKNGVYTMRYANQAPGQVQFVASTQVGLIPEVQPTTDKKHWEIVLRRPVGEVSQVAMNTTGGKGVPVITAKKPGPVVFKPAITQVAASTISNVKPVTVNLPKGAPASSMKTAPVPKPAPAFVPAKNVLLPTQQRITPSLVGQTAVPGTGEDKRVSLDVVAADINDVIKALALQSGINVVTSTDVKGNITVSLKRIPMIEALDTITRLSGYQYARLNSGYIVGTPASVAALTAVARETPLVTDYIRYRYLSSADLYATLRSKFPGLQLPGEGATTDGNPAQSKLLVLTDTAERIEKVRTFIGELDKAASSQVDTQVTELYKIKAANATDLIRLVQQLAPSVIIQVGVAQAFQASGTGQSASFSAGGSFGPSQAGAGVGAGGSPPAGGGGAATGGPGATQTGGAINSPTTLVLTGTPESIARARQILEQIDVRTPQISYEARVVDVNREDLQQLGLRYDFTRQVFLGERNETGQGTVGPVTGSGPASNPNFGAILRSPYTIAATLDALANQNRARTLASPNLSAIDGQPATAFIGDQIKYVIAVQQTQQGQTIQTETATVGITLKVTGKASPDGYITLYVHPEVSSITSFANLGNGISLPQISTRFVDTTIRVKSGETIAIGGLLREQDVNNLQKVPIIGDIPILGQLFRRSEKRKSRSEIVVFVTAKATEDGG